MRVSTMADGLVIDIDEDFVHLGLPDGSITRSIPHESVGLMEIQFMEGSMDDSDFPFDEDVH